MTTHSPVTHVTLHGFAHASNDVMRQADAAKSPIMRLTSLETLGETVARWIAQGRSITAIHPSDYGREP